MSVYRKVAALVNKDKPSSCYDSKDGDLTTNPVLRTFEKQLEYVFAKKKSPEETDSRQSALFDLWNNYENRLPTSFLYPRMLDVGDALVSIHEYSLALQLCYTRYLMKCFGQFLTECITTPAELKSVFFPNGFRCCDDVLTARALLGKVICSFRLIQHQDPQLDNECSVQQIGSLLSFLQTLMEVILPEESLCWIIYNATIHMYTICLHLMKFGRSALAIDYLLWASMCMETSVPLLSVKYLPWRSTLYTAACQCYNDLKQTHMSEAFARRAVAKINELSELMKISSQPANHETEVAFRTATVKMAVMVFKRTVFETRKRPKGVLRPKQQMNLKEVLAQPWPRTATEKLLVSVCQGSAAQMLCILEALTDSNRRVLISAAPVVSDMAGDSDILDVYNELFLAAQEIIGGGGGNPGKIRRKDADKQAFMSGINQSCALMDLASKGEDGVPLNAVVKLVKLAYCFRQWEFYDCWLPRAMSVAQEYGDTRLVAELKIVQAFDRVATPHGKQRKQQADEKGANKLGDIDDLYCLASVLQEIVCGSFKPEDVDVSLVIDAVVHLWNKCKLVFGRCQPAVINSPKYLEKIDNCGKWVYMLEVVQHAVHWSGLSTTDPILSADCSLRLALIYEAAAQLAGGPGAETSRKFVFASSNLDKSPVELLQRSQEILHTELSNVSLSMEIRVPTNGRAVADIIYMKEYNGDLFGTWCVTSNAANSDGNSSQQLLTDGDKEAIAATDRTAACDAVWEQIKDMHVEMLFHYHRIMLKLSTHFVYGPTEMPTQKLRWHNPDALIKTKKPEDDAYTKLMKGCRRNRLSLMFHCLQRALKASLSDGDQDSAAKLVAEASGHLGKMEAEERRLFRDNVIDVNCKPVNETSTPGAPILVSRTDTTMTFRPSIFMARTGEQVTWYRLFGRTVVSSDVKARLSDCLLPGTGQYVPASDLCEFRVTGLIPGEKYVFAVSAYTSDGQLIGGTIGESTKPILASHPTNLVMAWNYLIQVSYQVGCNLQVKETFLALWNHFIEPQLQPFEMWSTQRSQPAEYQLTIYRLNRRLLHHSSNVLLRSTLMSFFSACEVTIRDQQLYCDVLCENNAIILDKQIARLHLCEMMLPAMELAGFLNDANSALQVVAHCYGLLAPLVHFKIASKPVLQILERCVAMLQQIPGPSKRSPSTAESLNHMIACISYYLAKVLRNWGESNLAEHFNEVGRKLMNPAYDPRKELTADGTGTMSTEEIPEPDGFMDLGVDGETKSKENISMPLKNAELAALEQNMQKVNKQQTSTLNGSEDLSVLYGIIAYLPSSMAFVEVKKFKRRPRYLEFFVQLAHKGLAEGNAELAIGWCADAEQILFKRNESMYGVVKSVIGKQAMTIMGDDQKMFQAAMVEYSKEQQPAKSQNRSNKAGGNETAANQTSRKEKKGEDTTFAGVTDPQKLARLQNEARARNALRLIFIEFFRDMKQRRKLRQQMAEERPWRSELNTVQGLSHMGSLLSRLDSFSFPFPSFIYRPAFLDPTWFTLDAAAVVIVQFSGALHYQLPTQKKPVEEALAEPASKQSMKQQKQQLSQPAVKPPYPAFVSPIERAANSIMSGEVQPTARVARAVGDETVRRNAKNVKLEDAVSVTRTEVVSSLLNTFAYLTRSVVLAHRGRHWTLLQNTCRNMWNCVQLAMFASHAPDKDGNDVLSINDIRMVLCRPLFVAADCLLDMIVQTGQQLNQRFEIGAAGTDLPQWLGSIADEQGGAGVRFDLPHDDMTTVDARCLKRIVMLSIELLYFQQKWEKLVDIALRFNAVTGYRYAETVNSLLIHAQHQLIRRVMDNGGQLPPQDHMSAAVNTNDGQPISAADYIKLQLCLQFNGSELDTNLEPGARIDPRGHMPYSNKRALQSCSVPLDVTYSLQTLRDALGMSNYTARALENSRRLLVLYLAGQSEAAACVSMEPAATSSNEPWPTFVPRDVTSAQFNAESELTCNPCSATDLTVVIKSYEKTIEMLTAKGKKGLKTEALRELGNIHYHAKNVKSAVKYWCEALDTLVDSVDIISNWRGAFNGVKDIPCELLHKCGLWGCLIGGIIASNVAQYSTALDNNKRHECCFLAGYFFKALFRASLPHPYSDRDYAMYDVGDGCSAASLVPGVDLLSERYRSDARTVVAAVRFVTDELSRAHHHLFILPLLTLYQYWTSSVCRDVMYTVDCRLLRLRSLTELGLFSDAIETLQQLVCGERLPQPLNGQFRMSETRTFNVKFNTQLPLVDETNMTVIDNIYECRLPARLGALYGPHLACRLAIEHSHLLVKIADTIRVLPAASASSQPLRASRKKAEKGDRSPSSPERQDASEKPSKSSREPGKLGADTSVVRDVALDAVKTLLLKSAETMLSSISDTITNEAIAHDGLEQMSASELEITVKAKMELSAIASQRHHSLLAAKYLLDAMRLIECSMIFASAAKNTSKKSASSSSALLAGSDANNSKDSVGDTLFRIIESETSRYHLQNMFSRWHLDGRLWLTCRLSLVRCLLDEQRGFGRLSDGSGVSHQQQVSELADVDCYCTYGLSEAETMRDVELQAEFLYCGAILHLINGRPVSKALLIFNEIESLLMEPHQLSNSGQQLIINVKLHKFDLEILSRQLECRLEKAIAIQDLVLALLKTMGESLELHCDETLTYCKTVGSPIGNIYLSQLPLLVHSKLRVGQALAATAAGVMQQFEPIETLVTAWNNALSVLCTTRELNNVIAGRNICIVAEIHFNIGQVQRQLFHLGHHDPAAAGKSFVQAISSNIATDNDLGFLRKAYCELALIYLARCGLLRLNSHNFLSPVSDSGLGNDVSKSKEWQAAWLSIGCAAACAKARRQRMLFALTINAMEQKIGPGLVSDLPDFVALDCAGPVALAPATDLSATPRTESSTEFYRKIPVLQLMMTDSCSGRIDRARQAMADVSWNTILSYQTTLQRACNVLTLNFGDAADKSSFADDSCTDYNDPLSMIAFILKEESKFGPLPNVLRSLPFAERLIMRLGKIHSFICKSQKQYAEQCIAVCPPAALSFSDVITDEQTSQLDGNKSYVIRYLGNQLKAADGTPLDVRLVTSPVVLPKQDDKPLLQPADGLLAVQWYQSSLDRVIPSDKDSRQILWFFASNEKGQKKRIVVRWVAVSQLQLIHQKVTALLQSTQLSKPASVGKIAKKKSNENAIKSVPSSGDSVSAADEQLMLSIQHLLSDIRELFYVCSTTPSSDQVVVDSAAAAPSMTSTSSKQSAATKTSSSSAASTVTKSVAESKRSSADVAPKAATPQNSSNDTAELVMLAAKLESLELMFNTSSGVLLVDTSIAGWIKGLQK